MDAWEQIAALRREGVDFVVVTIIGVRGSVPGQLGSKAVVTAAGLVAGNLGGGKVEAKAVHFAQAMLETADTCVQHTWNLQQDVGMTCGGEMSFLFEKVVTQAPWHIVVFGAGHVAQALIPLLSTLSCELDVIDTRPEWLEKLPPRRNVRNHHLESFEAGTTLLSARSFAISVTTGHAADRPVVRKILREFPEIAFLGVIGSASKRAVMLRDLREDGLNAALLEKIVCPIGLPIGGNDPAEIAVSIAAQLLGLRDLR